MSLEGLLGYPLMGGGSALTTRLLQHWFPTPLERAQLESTLASIRFQEQRIELDQLNAVRQIEAQRDNVLRQIEATQINLERQIAANADLESDRELRRRWPQGATSAEAIVRASRNFGGRHLNVILRTSYRADTKAEEHQPFVHLASGAISDACAYFASRGGDKLLVYNDAVLAHFETGDRLVATVSSLTSTEPCALVEVHIGGGRFSLSLSCWGWGGDSGAPEVGAPVVVEFPEGEDSRNALTATIVAAVASIEDRFRTLVSLGSPPSLRAFPLLRHLPDCRLVPYSGFDVTSRPMSLTEAIVRSHRSTIEQIGQRAPILAAEAAARAALDAHDIDRPDLAAGYLDLALEYFTHSVTGARGEDLVAALMRTPAPNGQEVFLRAALNRIRGIPITTPEEEDDGAPPPKPGDIGEHARRLLKSPQSDR